MFFRPWYLANLVPNWIPALNGVRAKLWAGARVAYVGCGLGAVHRAARRGLPSFEVASAQTFSGTGLRPGDHLRLPARHGRPARRRRHVLAPLGADRTWLVVEPFAGDAIADNLSPVGRTYYELCCFLRR
ncbi:MAG: hypothetical protein ACRDRX_22135 [Pseudonocardiaceae bacterium]